MKKCLIFSEALQICNNTSSDGNPAYNCAGWNKYQHEAECFQENPTCPTKTITQQFDLSLSAILGYHIRSYVSMTKQSVYVQVSITMATIMLVVGLVFGILSILTFQSKACQKVGCGAYFVASSITSILTIVGFCISTAFILRVLLVITDWYHASVAIERLATVIFDVNFNFA
ncbi:unnamed protein product [Rotaria magnacalcarata]|uniref:Uncharacterized protein n=1 Tax=Rotaria magnacalcarata TaxID=392030 RepID=A0A819T2W8_9BILA|nr:unnamed protein product [Rotaria magnacalcarata]CAF4880023.1 unnamed protein product [Rotaria magnacalcarata]CAF5037678.1 unnamed protein product [Rotaria magnacalcarata]CAF5172964.1 unnamed protein product [Rotaria magnacalcarata]